MAPRLTPSHHLALGVAALACLLTACAAAPTPPGPALTPALTARNLPDAQPLRLDESVWSLLGTRLRLEADPVNQQLNVLLQVERPPAPLNVQLPLQWAGQTDLTRTFRDLRASCGDRSLPIELIDNGQLRIDHDACRVLQLRYHVLIDRGLSPAEQPGLRRRSRLDALGMILHGPAAIALPWDASGSSPLGLGAGGVAVEIIAPTAWRVGATWRPVEVPGAPLPPAQAQADRAVWRFLAYDLGHLIDAVVVAGDLRHQRAELPDGRLLHLLTLGDLPLSDDALRQMLERVVAAQRRFLPPGWAWPAGTERLTVVALGSGDAPLLEGGGRRGGFIVEIGANAQPIEIAELLAHEAFHVVNGHLLVHQPQAEFDTLWFKEGITTWVAALTLVRAGFADPSWLLTRLGELAETYYGNPLALRLPMHRVGATFWTDVHARRLPYDKGALLGLLLDASLHPQSAPTALEAWFAWLLERVAQRGLAYDNATLQDGLAAIGGQPRDVAALFERFVYGMEALPLQDALARLDLRLARGMAPAPYYGFDLGYDARGAFIASLDPDGPAARLGLVLGDRLLGEPAVPLHRTHAAARLNLLRLGRVVPVTIHPERGLRERYTVTPLRAAADDPLLRLLGPPPGP